MASTLDVLIGFERFGVLRDAFRALGHRAYSCDLADDANGSPYHIKGDIMAHLDRPWALAIFHPPCTYLSSSGMHWTTRGLRDPQLTEHALDMVRRLMAAPYPHAIENPVGAISSQIRKPDQIIQPWHFGDDASKRTCLWLKGLPLLREANRLPGDNRTRRANQTPSGQNRLGPSPERAMLRAKTYPGIANAMAHQWTKHIAAIEE